MLSGRNNQIYIIIDYFLKGLSRKDKLEELDNLLNLHSMIHDTHECERKEWKIIVNHQALWSKMHYVTYTRPLCDFPTRK